MSAIREADVKAVLGEIDALVLHELVRTKASPAELASAIDCARQGSADAFEIRRGYPSRVKRLVDLVSVTCLGNGEGRIHAA